MDYSLNTKNKGQVFTPEGVVITILDEIGYKDEIIIKSTILEPSFGEGVFLIEIIKRIIIESRKQGLSNQDIINIIKNNVYGIEKDDVLFNKTLERLNSLLKSYEINSINWTNNLFNGDTFYLYKNFLNKFDYVVGNPPYVRIHNIDDSTRNILDTFKFSDGTTDMYIMFYEMSLEMLNAYGKLGFITPNSFMKNTSQINFRDYLIDNKYISKIFDFKASKIFKNFDTYTCICILNKNSNRDDISIEYREYDMYTVLKSNTFSFDYFKNIFKNQAWNLSSLEDIIFLEEIKQSPIKIGNIGIVQNGITTNRDSVYISKAWLDKEETQPYMGKHTDKPIIVYFNGYPIESNILHRCIKASRYNGIISNNYIIFPYKPSDEIVLFIKNEIIDTNYMLINENELINRFPKAYKYLAANFDSLSTRDMEKNSLWYQFGRSQGLQNICYKKIVFKHIISKDAEYIFPYIVDNDVIVYSGVYTTVNINNYITPNFNLNLANNTSNYYDFNEEMYVSELNRICSLIKTPDFTRYCKLVGKDMSGNYVTINTKHIKNFGVNLNHSLYSFDNIPNENLD